MRKLILQASRSFIIGVVAFGVVLFPAAGTLRYWQGWVFAVVFNGAANVLGIYLTLTDPALLARRMNMKETRPRQRAFGPLVLLVSIALLVCCALDYRFGWSKMPPAVWLVGNALLLLSLLGHIFVFRENTYGGTTIRVVEGQHVITTGPYAIVRHPMYTLVLLMLIAIPLALGSWWGLAFLPLYLAGLVWRILDEEKMLEEELPGYREYEQQVRWRLVPAVW